VAELPPHPLQGAQVDQHVDERVLVGDGLAVAQLGARDTQRDGLGVDALGGGALLVDVLIDVTVTVEIVANVCPFAYTTQQRIEKQTDFARSSYPFYSQSVVVWCVGWIGPFGAPLRGQNLPKAVVFFNKA